MRDISLLTASLLLGLSVMFSGCGGGGSDSVDVKEPKKNTVTFSYDGDTGPAYWYTLSPDYYMCKEGLTFRDAIVYQNHQSPVDLYPTALREAQFSLDFNKDLEFELENNGHTIELKEVSPNEDAYIIIGGIKYKVLQFHFHSKSEHLEETKHADMEMHIVCKDEDSQKVAVLGFLIDIDNENPNSELSKVFSKELPLANQTSEEKYIINLANFIPADDVNVYSYSGSFTTPPCSEGVAWNIYKEHLKIDSESANRFITLYDHNFRPVTGKLTMP